MRKIATRTYAARSISLTVVGGCLLGSLLAGCDSEQSVSTLRVRKDVKDLTAAEKQDYVDAVLALKGTPSPYDPEYSYYDQFTVFHKQAFMFSMQSEPHVAHAHPTVFPWHRKMLVLFEDALREVSRKDITLPYWDWTDPESTEAVFSESFMGTAPPLSGACHRPLRGGRQ